MRFRIILSLTLSACLFISTPAITSGSSTQTRKPVRRALLIGIQNYEHDPLFRTGGCDSRIQQSPAKATPSSSRGGFQRLDGTLNDVCALRQLLIDRYQFEPGNIHLLVDKDATREGILSAFKRLIDEAQPGDVCLFFYSGHGSQVKNTLGGEPDQLDETIVPYDWKRPITKREEARDIRDKEIFKLFRDAAQKVTLTALFDSCHSGGISRGGVTGVERSKTGPGELQFDFAESPPDKEQQTLSDQEFLERNGVLVISAARDDQEAKEKEYNDQARGNFSYSLIKVLQSPNAGNLSVARIFDKLIVQMKIHNATHDPIIVGSATRRLQTLFGEPVDPLKRPEVNVERVDAAGNIFLQGGLALGFHKGTELVKKTETGGDVRICIVEEPDFVRSRAEIVTDGATRTVATVRANDTFVLDKLSVARAPDLTVWMPRPKLTLIQLNSAAAEIEKLRQAKRIQLISDPTGTLATHFLSHDGENWILRLPDSQLVTLGPTLATTAILDRLPKTNENVILFASLPPAAELTDQIRFGEGTANNAVGWARNKEEADYWLIGRQHTDANGPVLEYAWLAPSATTGSSNPGVSPLPPITGWRPRANELEDLALRLSKIRGWTKLDSPLGESGRFAYRMVIKNGAGQILSGDNATVTEGETLNIYLAADENLLQPPIERRYVYILSLDQFGKSDLMYPDLSDGVADTPIPYVSDTGKIATEFKLVGVKVCGPNSKTTGWCRNPGVLGAETYIMLTTTDRLPDPTVLRSEGVRTPEDIARDAQSKGMRGEESPLANLLAGIGSTSRGERVVPLNWSVQQVFLRSVEKKP